MDLFTNILSTLVVVSLFVFFVFRFVFESDPFPERFNEIVYAVIGCLFILGGASLFTLLMMDIWA